MRLRAVLFDYGGTLDGEASHWLDRFVALYRDTGLDLPRARLHEAFYAADDAADAEPRLATASLDELMEFHVAIQLEWLGLRSDTLQRHLVERFVSDSLRCLAASRRTLERLQPAFRLGVVSNFYGNVQRILGDAGLGPLLAIVADSRRIGLRKPDPAIYRWAADQLSIPVNAIMHVGDSYERDVVAAHNAGLRTAWLVGDRLPPEPERSTADLCLRSLDELLAYLDLF